MLDFAGITPIIKRIATSSFVLVSLGYSLLVLALCYWWIDLRNHRRRLEFFTIVGMNSIFIYLFFEIVGDRWFTGYITAISNGITRPLHPPALLQGIIASFVSLASNGDCAGSFTGKRSSSGSDHNTPSVPHTLQIPRPTSHPTTPPWCSANSC